MAKPTRHRRREREEEPPQFEEIEVNPEEVELSDFLDGLGPQGISDVSLYRILPSGKQRFITSGPPSQFSEQYVQAQFGEGDFLARAKLNGRWYKSKSFSVEAAPGTVAALPTIPSHDAELERLKAQIESQRLEIERDRQAREQRNHELQLKMLEALGNRGSQAAGPTITELIAGLRGLKELSGNGSSLVGVKELLDVADKIVALRGDGTDSEDSSFGGVLKSIAKSIGPELAQALSQILVARNGPTSGASLPVDVAATTTASDVKVETPVIATMPLPTAYDQIAGQLCGLIDRLQAQVKAGLSADMAVEGLLALDQNNDPITRLVLNAVEKSLDFESWLVWFRSQVGTDVIIEQQTKSFLSKVFEIVKAFPPAEVEEE